MRYLIAGLGNIGEQYSDTRHNIGFFVVDEIAKKKSVDFELSRHAFITKVKVRNKIFFLMKPTTLMNLSGKAIRYWLNYLKLPTENLLVIYDDIALPLAQVRVREKGSPGGHNGLIDIIATLGTDKFPRMRIGIGDNFSRGKQSDYVLGEWTEDEKAVLQQNKDFFVDAVYSFAI